MFEHANTLTEIYAEVRKLKAEGMSTVEVNRLATLRKKEIMISQQDYKVLNKILPKTSSTNLQKVSAFAIEVPSGTLNSASITVTDKGIIL